MRISDWSSDVCSSDLLQASLVHAEYEFRERSCKTQGRQIAVHPRPRRRSHEDPAMTTSAATESRVEIDGKIFNPYSKDFIRSPWKNWKRMVADLTGRSEEGRDAEGCVCEGRSWWGPY